MTNPYYNHSDSIPLAQTRGTSAAIRSEFDLVQAGFASVSADISAISAALGVGTTSVETSLAAGLTTDIGNGYGSFLNLTGSATITSFGSHYTGAKFIRSSGTIVLTNSASLICPGNQNITLNAGDIFIATPIGNPASGWLVRDVRRMSSILVDDDAVRQSGSYANPSWITSLAFSKIAGLPTTAAGYGITDVITTATIGSQSVNYAASAGTAASATTATSAGSATTATTASNLSGGVAGSVPYQSGAGATAMVPAGSSGSFLTSQGAAAPTWTFPPIGLNGVQVFTSSGTFTVPAGITKVKVWVVGGGGTGGPTSSYGCGATGGGGGGAGGVGQAFISGLTPGANITVTVAPGASGSASSFGAYATATGGGPGATPGVGANGGFTTSGATNYVIGGAVLPGTQGVPGGAATGVGGSGAVNTLFAGHGYGGSGGSNGGGGVGGGGGLVIVEY